MSLQLSVVMPSHRRRERLLSTLQALGRQTLSPERYEVIVVVDGEEPETVAAAQALRTPYALRVLQQPASGAAAARNRGARAAAAPLVLFLDDDMHASPELLQAHLQAQQDAPGVTLGYFHAANLGSTDDVFQVSVNLWWSGRFAEIGEASHRFTFLDVFTGNVAMPKALCESAGGFDEGFKGKAGEDYELGIRLLQQRARFTFVPRAASVHCDALTVGRSLQRAVDEGRGHVLIARKHPEAFMALPLRAAVETPLPSGAGWVGPHPGRMALVVWLLRAPLALAGALKLRRWWHNLYGIMRTCCYWQGVLAETGSLANLQRLMQECPLVPEPLTEAEIDLATHLGRLDEVLSAAPIDALRVRFGATALGRIPAAACAEPLRARHVRKLLVDWYAHPLTAAARRQEQHAAAVEALR